MKNFQISVKTCAINAKSEGEEKKILKKTLQLLLESACAIEFGNRGRGEPLASATPQNSSTFFSSQNNFYLCSVFMLCPNKLLLAFLQNMYLSIHKRYIYTGRQKKTIQKIFKKTFLRVLTTFQMEPLFLTVL